MTRVVLSKRPTVVKRRESVAGFSMDFVIAIRLRVCVHIVQSHFGLHIGFDIEWEPKLCES
jgi:hypothetical protein